MRVPNICASLGSPPSALLSTGYHERHGEEHAYASLLHLSPDMVALFCDALQAAKRARTSTPVHGQAGSAPVQSPAAPAPAPAVAPTEVTAEEIAGELQKSGGGLPLQQIRCVSIGGWLQHLGAS